MVQRLVLVMRVFVMFLFAWAFVAAARVATGASEGLGPMVLPVIAGPIALILVGYVLAAQRSRQPATKRDAAGASLDSKP